MHPLAELIALQAKCPNCNSQDVSFVTYEIDNEAVFNCDCGWSAEISLSDLKEFGFYPENFENIS